MASKKKGRAVVETSASIAEQTAAFLKAGGKVEQVPRGVSGQTNISARRHITISRS